STERCADAKGGVQEFFPVHCQLVRLKFATERTRRRCCNNRKRKQHCNQRIFTGIITSSRTSTESDPLQRGSRIVLHPTAQRLLEASARLYVAHACGVYRDGGAKSRRCVRRDGARIRRAARSRVSRKRSHGARRSTAAQVRSRAESDRSQQGRGCGSETTGGSSRNTCALPVTQSINTRPATQWQRCIRQSDPDAVAVPHRDADQDRAARPLEPRHPLQVPKTSRHQEQ
uniref:Uncharacterized protein n=1 Tax=Globisporangium ultimum (strain ATCC 200006 / CBS 805.95 / DAOM BR144) TaxID=431595 RepID=K3WGJ6_GLOUD